METGSSEALYRLGALNETTQNYAEAVKLYGRGAAHDDYRAMVSLGEMYEQGRGVQKDVGRAVKLYEQAGNGSPWAQFKLGVLYSQGEALPADYAKALAWWHKSADGGNIKAINNLGVMYDRGLGVSVDYQQALSFYLKARALPQAKGNLQAIFEEGRGAPDDPAKRATWYRVGADAGVAAAQFRLGMLYAKGIGLPRDNCAAAELLSAAENQGYPNARNELSDLLFTMGQAYESNKQLAVCKHLIPYASSGQDISTILFSQSLFLGNKRAVDYVAAKYERMGNLAAAQQVRGAYGRISPPRQVPPHWPAGFDLTLDEDQQRVRQIRIASVGQVQSAGVAIVNPDIYTIIYWRPPSTK